MLNIFADRMRVKREAGMEFLGILPPQKPGDAGLDLVAAVDIVVPPWGETPADVPCGFSAKLPSGFWAEIRPRSSTAKKMGIFVYQSVMDEGYTGPWFVICNALGTQAVKVAKGTRLAQCLLHRSYTPDILEVEDLPHTTRGATGFGSSGSKI